jgi:hypothetical protein
MKKGKLLETMVECKGKVHNRKHMGLTCRNWKADFIHPCSCQGLGQLWQLSCSKDHCNNNTCPTSSSAARPHHAPSRRWCLILLPWLWTDYPETTWDYIWLPWDHHAGEPTCSFSCGQSQVHSAFQASPLYSSTFYYYYEIPEVGYIIKKRVSFGLLHSPGLWWGPNGRWCHGRRTWEMRNHLIRQEVREIQGLGLFL